MQETPEFEYAIETLPVSRLGRRWRWELWNGAALIAAGWNLSPRRAEQAVRTAALRRVHQASGVVALPSAFDVRLSGGALVDRAGRALCVLRMREPALGAAARQAA